mgnify:CR=1 FL=1
MASKRREAGILFHSFVYWLGVVISKLASFILVPVFTHHLSPSDYGTLELITTTTGVFALLIGGRLNSALFRFYHTAKTAEEKNEVVSTALLLGSGAALAFGVALHLTAEFFSRLVLKSDEGALFFQIMFASMLLGIVQDLGLAYLRVKERSVLFAAVNLLRVVLMLSLNTVFIVYFHMGIMGALLGPAIAGVLFTPVILYATLRQTGVAFSAGLSWQLLKFSAPLVPAALAMFIVHFSDRYILREFGTLEAVGLYAVAYKFGMLVSTLVGQPFSLIWGNRLHSYYWHENRDALYNETLSGLTFALCLVALGISLFIEPVLALMTPPEYWEAGRLVPIIAFGYVLFVLHSISCAPFQSEAKTGKLAIISIGTAVLSLLSSLALIPFAGALGAAVATALAFGFMLVWSRLEALRFSPLRIEYDRAWKPLAGAALIVALEQTLAIDRLWAAIAVKALLLAAYPALLLLIGFPRPDELQRLLSRIRGRLPAAGRV